MFGREGVSRSRLIEHWFSLLALKQEKIINPDINSTDGHTRTLTFEILAVAETVGNKHSHCKNESNVSVVQQWIRQHKQQEG